MSTSVRLQTHSVYGGHVGRRSDLYIAAEAERQFSTAGKIITPARAMLDPVWLRINSFIRLNMNMVVDYREGSDRGETEDPEAVDAGCTWEHCSDDSCH